MLRRFGPVIVFLGLFSLILAGCAPAVGAGQENVEQTLELISQDQQLGQTFLSRHAGLSGIDVYLLPGENDSGEMRLTLRDSPSAGIDLAESRLPVSLITGPGFYRFDFPPVPDSYMKSYYYVLEAAGEGSIRAGSAAGPYYLEGALYRGGEPVDAQMAFRLYYDFYHKALGITGQVGRWAVSIFLASLLLVLPGWALLTGVLRRFHTYHIGVQIPAAAAASLSLHSLILLWTDVAGVHLGRFYAWIPIILSAVYLLWHYRSGLQRQKIQQIFQRPRGFSVQQNLPDILFLLLVICLLFSRFWAIRTVPAPLGSDSIQHVTIAQLILDNQGKFDSWLPYTPYKTLTVHFSFHTAVALFAWLSGGDVLQSTLIIGQFLNVLAVLAVFPLAMLLSKNNRWAAAAALLFAGLLSPMPAFYLNWGRYPQLTGQSIMPVALWLVFLALAEKDRAWPKILLAGITLAGTLLGYYMLIGYYVIFVFLWLVCWAVPSWKKDFRAWRNGLLRLALIAVIGLVLLSPWLVEQVRSILGEKLKTGIESGRLLDQVIQDYQTWRAILFYVPYIVMLPAAAGFIYSLARRKWQVAAVGLWAVGMSLIVASTLIHFPFANFYQNVAIVIALYIPASLLAGWLTGELARSIESRANFFGAALVFVLFAGLGAWGTAKNAKIANPNVHAFVNNPDLRAMAWIKENTPADARFLVQGQAFKITTVIGGDAGWLLPLLAKRENSMPPQYALIFEKPIDPDYTQEVVDLVFKLEEVQLSDARVVPLLCEKGITHLYIGQKQAYDSPAAEKSFFLREEVLENPAFESIYYQDRVSVFALNPEFCSK